MRPVAAERAELQRSAAWDRARLTPAVPPGSDEEARALAAIDMARENAASKVEDTPRKRARRARRYWRARGLHVGL